MPNTKIQHCPCQGFVLVKSMTPWCRSSMIVSLLWIRCCKSFSKGNFWGPIPTLCWETMALTNSSPHSFVLQHMDVIQQTRCATWSKNLAFTFRLSAIRARKPSNEQVTKSAARKVHKGRPSLKRRAQSFHPLLSPLPWDCTSEATEIRIRDLIQLKINTLVRQKGFQLCKLLALFYHIISWTNMARVGGMLLLMVIRTH